MANTPYDVFKSINMEKGDKEKCWPWKRSLNKTNGRPYFTSNRQKKEAYVLVLELHSCEEANNRVVMHQCDNPICCNPFHLKWGTHEENMQEMKDRERHGVPKTVIRAMKKLRDMGLTHAKIAERYGLDRSTVSKILGTKIEDGED